VAAPAAKPVVPEQKAPQVSTPETKAPETKPVSKPVAKPKAAPEPAPVPDKDLPPEEDPSYFERMLEKIGF
jgi:outer membrane protein assembly factor BamE